jgi:ABC-type protease/lipase transport system fused ATPase/permease subunit
MATDPRVLLGETPPASTPLARAVAACRAQFMAVAVFSGVVNVLQLTVSLYMMQVFDRVLSTRNLNTLLYLTLIALVALALMALLEGARSRIMQRIGNWMEEKVAPEGFARAVESQLRGRAYRMEALRDLGTVRGFLGSPGALALYDVPWVPAYLFVIFLLHPLLGWVSLVGAALLLALTIFNELATSKLLREANTAAMGSQRRAESIVRNAEVIDSMGMLPAVMARWQKGVAEMSGPMNRAMDRAAPLLAMTKFCRLAVQVAILGIGAFLVLEQQLTAGASIAASIIMGRALAPVEQMIGGWKQLVQARQSWKRLQAFLVLPRLRPPGIALPEPTGRLTVERVTYGFPRHQRRRGEGRGLRAQCRREPRHHRPLRRRQDHADPAADRHPRTRIGRRAARWRGRAHLAARGFRPPWSATCRRMWNCSTAPCSRTSPAWRRHRPRRCSRPRSWPAATT